MVGSGPVRPMQGKVTAIGEFGRPKMKRDVRSFLGVYGYYHQFINNFSTVARPLFNSTKKLASNKIVWERDCHEAFKQLKRALTEAPVLVTSDRTQPFIVQTEFSAFGLEYVLSQVNKQTRRRTPNSICFKETAKDLEELFNY